eukprot:jgi/Ulvmu1/1376/UM011_0104.1
MYSTRAYARAFRTGLLVGGVSIIALTVIAAAILWGEVTYPHSGGANGQAEIRRFRVMPELLTNLVHGVSEKNKSDGQVDVTGTPDSSEPVVLAHQLLPQPPVVPDDEAETDHQIRSQERDKHRTSVGASDTNTMDADDMPTVADQASLEDETAGPTHPGSSAASEPLKLLLHGVTASADVSAQAMNHTTSTPNPNGAAREDATDLTSHVGNAQAHPVGYHPDATDNSTVGTPDTTAEQKYAQDGATASGSPQLAQDTDGETYVKQLDWPPNWGLAVVPEEAGVPHARDCAVCDRCLTTEQPGIRLDTTATGISDKTQASLRRLAAQRRAAADALCSGQTREASDRLSGKSTSQQERVCTGRAGPEAGGHAALSQRQLAGRALAGSDQKDPASERVEPEHPRLKYLLVEDDARFPDRRHPHCPVCQGCTYNLTDLAAHKTQFSGIDYASPEGGNTNARLFVTQHPKSRTGRAVAKVYCTPHTEDGARAPTCSRKLLDRVASVSLPQEKLSQRCGFESVVPRMWTAPLNSLSPDGRSFLSWDALWMERAEGVSVAMLTQMASSRAVQQAREALGDTAFDELLTKTLRSHDVVLAAIWDLLTMQCDRHAQNVYVDEGGRVTLIDADQALGDGWRVCGVDSIFLPTTQKYMINLLGWAYVMKHPPGQPQQTPAGELSAQVALDYRCHAPRGAIGLNYPERVKQCLGDISNMTYRQVQMEFGMAKMAHAIRLHQRASDLVHRGFEWTLQHGEPRNPWALQYPLTPACCDLHVHLAGAKCLSKEPFIPWVPPRDSLSCGSPSSGRDPAAKIREQGCRDISGRRRSGFWDTNSTRADVMNRKRRIALGEWELMQRDVVPRDNASVWEEAPSDAAQGREQGVAGVWPEPLNGALHDYPSDA